MRIWCCSLLIVASGFAHEFTQPVTNNTHISSSNISTKTGHATTKSSTNKSKTAPATSSLTCGARTVNYVTDILPQQCLRTDWTRSRTSYTSTTSEQSGQASVGSGSSQDVTSTDVQATAELTSSQSLGTYLVSSSAASSNQDETSTSVVVSPTPIPESVSAIEANPEPQSDPLLDESSFLSFEDWKQQNLAKAGQSGENLGAKHVETGRRAPDINDFDTLGDENEIEIDFSGFGGVAQPPQKPRIESAQSSSTTGDSAASQDSHASQALRPRDAGKTCKERTNYASFDCAATVLKSNSECKSASSVLIENKDSYMLNKCSAKDKHFVVELCNDILVDTIVLANFEFFSSIFRHFKVSVSDRYPPKNEGWKDLGTFEAKNTREVQAFLVENPLIWARYLKIEFLTHYGSEYYCPISLLRVHGTTMMEEFRNQEESARGDQPQDTAHAVSESAPPDSAAPTTSDAVLIESKESAIEVKSSLTKLSDDKVSRSTAVSAEADQVSALHGYPVRGLITTSPARSPFLSRSDTCPLESPATSSTMRSSSLHEAEKTASYTVTDTVIGATSNKTGLSTSKTMSSGSSSPAASISSNGTSSISSLSSNSTNTTAAATDVTAKSSISNTTVVNSTSKEAALLSSPTTNITKPQSSSSTAPQPQPSTQESFFKSISKRLQQLESNSTLSMQYIEQSSRILREAFSKVEKRQIGSTTTFLSNLNNTVMAELAGFRQAYDQLWQSTVIELEGQREQHHREMTDLSSRLTLVVDELVWQKRMGIVQSTLLLLCLALVLFARNGSTSIEIPFMHQVMSRSQAAFRSNPGSDQNSPSSGRSPVSLFRRKIWKSDGDSASSRPGTSEGIIQSGLATPHSLDEQEVPIITYTAHEDFSGSESEADYAE